MRCNFKLLVTIIIVNLLFILALYLDNYYEVSRLPKDNKRIYKTITQPFKAKSTIIHHNEDMACNLPDIDALNPIKGVEEFIEYMPSKFDCKRRPRKKHSLGIDSYVTANGSLIISLNKRFKTDLEVFIRPFERRGATRGDFDLAYGEEIEVTNSNSTINLIDLEMSFLTVIVRSKRTNKDVYTKSHCYPAMKMIRKPVVKLVERPVGSKKFNVFMLVIESLSAINFKRHLSRTRLALNRRAEGAKSKLFVMKGLTKLADNSWPNTIPLLTGLKTANDELPVTNEEMGPYDNLTCLWNMFEDKLVAH